MRRADKERLIRLHDCLNRIDALAPTNPANTRAIFNAHKVTSQALRPMMYALTALAVGDLAGADGYLADAERLIPKTQTERALAGDYDEPARQSLS